MPVISIWGLPIEFDAACSQHKTEVWQQYPRIWISKQNVISITDKVEMGHSFRYGIDEGLIRKRVTRCFHDSQP